MGLRDLFRKKKNPKPAPSIDAKATRHCFVLSRNVEPGDLSNASAVTKQILGEAYSAEVSDGIITINQGENSVGFLAHMPAPIPEGEASVYAEGNFLWPDGESESAKHLSHVIVTNVVDGDDELVRSAVNVTQLALVALELYDGIGVYWGNANVTNSREIFESFCQGATAEHVPVPVLLRFQFVPAEGDNIGIFTFGMNQFGLMDLEVDRCSMRPQELFEFVSNLAHYLIQSGPVIMDGNTVGESEEQRILVRHLPSMANPENTVYKIVFES